MSNSLNLPKNVPHNTSHTQFGVTYTYDLVNDVWTANAPPLIDDMIDVDTTTVPPTANQILSWDASSNNFIPSDGFDARLAASTTDDITEAGNLYFTTARARNSIFASGDLSYNSSTGVISYTERTDSEVRELISVSGDLSYNSSTGVISYIDPVIIDWSAVQNTPTTIAGYGITNAYSKSEVDNAINTIELTPGPAGADGTDGTNGTNGTNGAAGPAGPAGPPGPPGPQASGGSSSTTFGDVGTYAFLVKNGSSITSGSLVSGSSLQSGGMSAVQSITANNTSYNANISQLSRGDTTMSGSWRAMGSVTYSGTSTYGRGTVFLRIS